MIGIIVKGKRTAKHVDSLRTLGYTVEDRGDSFAITHEGFVEVLDLASPDALKQLVKEKKLLSYSTRVLFSDGKVLFGVPACTRLGEASCLVAKPERAAKVGGGGISVSSLLS